MRKFFKYMGKTVLAILLLVMLLVSLIYLPPVQRFVVNKTLDYARSHWGLVVRAEQFRLKYPLDLTLKEVYAGRTETDTLAAVGSLHLKVGLGQIFRRRLSVDELEVRRIHLRLADDSSDMELRVCLQKAALRVREVDLREHLAEAEFIRLSRGNIYLKTGKPGADTATATVPLDWKFTVEDIGLQQLSYCMNAESLPFLGAGLETGRLVKGKVSLQQQSVDADSLYINGAWCNFVTAGADTLKTEQPEDTLSSLPWTVRAAALQLDNGAFSLGNQQGKTAELLLSGIGVRMDSVYNRGTVVCARLKDLTATQEGGAAITSMQAGIVLDSAETALNGFLLRTDNSWLQADIHADTSMQELLQREPLSVVLKGRIDLRDVLPYFADIPEQIRNRAVDLNTVLSVTGKRIQIGQLLLSMPGNFKLTGSGSISSYRDPRKMKGSLALRGEMPDIAFARYYLEKEGIVIPRNLDLQLNLQARNGIWSSFLRLCCSEGCLSLDATYNMQQESYEADLALNHFPLNRFLSADAVGMVTAGIRLDGRGLTWSGASVSLGAHIRGLEFQGYDYRDIALEAALNRTTLKGSLMSGDPAMPLDLVFHGDSVGKDYRAVLGGKLGVADLEKLHFVKEPLRAGAVVDIAATLGSSSDYTLRAKFDSLEMTDARRKYNLRRLDLEMSGDLSKTSLAVNSGDLKLHFETDTSLNAFIDNAGKIGEVLGEQIRARNIDMEVVRSDLSPFSLQIEGARDNAVAGFLRSRNIGFQNIRIDVISRKRSGIRLGVTANAPYFGSVRLDSVQLGAWQTGKSLMYSVSAGSSSEAWKGLFNVNINGKMQDDRFRMELKQKNAAGETGFDLGLNLLFGDTTMTASFFPINPILGYSRWIVNPDNRIVIGPQGRIKANLRMAYLNKLINLQSLPEEKGMHDRLQIEIEGLDLAALSQTVPFMPQVTGVLNTDLHLYSVDKVMGADGSIGVVELGYEQQRIGTVDLGLQYTAGNNFTQHAVDFELRIDSIRRVVARGNFATSEENRNLMIDMNIPSLPLYLANAFMPADLMKLTGDLKGNVRFRGTLDKPEINGSLAFVDGKADVLMLGTAFRLDTTALPIRHGQIVFKKYRFIAPNNSDIVMNGDITLTPFDRMNMNLSVEAADFELVNVKKNDVSLIYGKAYVDIDSRISGAFSALNVTGKVNLLNRTGITYTLRSSDPQLVDKSVDLVRFVSFRDSTLNEADDLTNHIDPSSFALRMLIEIGDQVRVGVDLSEDGGNHVDIQGGGNLMLTMNPESGMVLSGKYLLSGGTVVYNVPIVGKKEFSIRNGSYVEWTGNVANPILNISASESVKANVDEGEQTRQVTFESIIRIQNTLTRPGITFDLSAPNDMVIQNQLATFSQEERTRQALNLLIYNTYTAPGAAKSGNSGNMANNAIYSFVENELNKYTQKAGLTVGFDSHNTDENTMRTDVTYQFSRQLFNDRIRVKIGGRISTDANVNQGDGLQDNLVDDISIEYVLTRKRNLYVKVFRHSNYESVLDGEVTQTGAGIVWRRNFRKFKDLFKNKNREERKADELRKARLNSKSNE